MVTAPEHSTSPSLPRTVIGVDAGGTSTKAVLLDETGRVLSLAHTGPGNPTSAGLELAVPNNVCACVQALLAAEEPVAHPSLVAYTMAGVIAAGGRLPAIEEGLRDAGVTAQVVFKGDVLSAYFSATAEPDGRVLIVGTGTTGARVEGGEIVDSRDGLGWLIGDEGSGFWIGRKVVRACIRSLEGRGPATALLDPLMEMVDTPAVLDTPWRDERLLRLLAWAYAHRPVELAAAARLVSQVPDDPVAAEIIDGAAARVLNTVRSLGGTHGDGPIVLGGSVVAPGAPVGEKVAAALGPQVLRARDGVAGSALIALRELGVSADAAALARITEGIAALRG